MRFPFFRNRDSVKNGILISIRRTGDGFHPGLFIYIVVDMELKGRIREALIKMILGFNIEDMDLEPEK